MTRDLELIKEHLHLLLTTARGELAGQPEYGCDLYTFIFREPGPALMEEVKAAVDAQVRRWEPLAEFGPVDVSERPDQPGVISIEIPFVVRRTGTRSNVVYPLALSAADLRPAQE